MIEVTSRSRRPSALVATLLLAVLLAPGLQAEPFVPGFDRFHATQPTEEGGRLLYNELGCANCHRSETGLPARRGPNLTGVAQRASAEWLRAFISDPSAGREGTTMPHLLPEASTGDLDAVVHYLGSLKQKATKTKAPKYVNPASGQELFHTRGCVACHAPDGKYQAPDGNPPPGDFSHRSVALPKLGEKYGIISLIDFLRDPVSVRPDGRMPRIEMTDDDANDLAAYLVGLEGSDGSNAPKLKSFAADPALASRGREVVAALRCAACHELPAEVAAKPVALRRTDGGCLAPGGTAGVPDFHLSETQRAALQKFLAKRDQPAPAPQLATLTMEALNCAACHERDGRGGPDAARKAFFQGDHNLGDTGRYPPPLTGVGRKLQTEWLADVLAGKARVRPYLKTQMPIYGGAVATLPALLAKTDQKPEQALPGGDDTAGRKLLGTLGGVGCITCHRWGDHPALGIQALDLSNLGQRIQPGWLAEYLVNPAGYRPGTLMPSFWPAGKAANQEILGGDTAKQIASIHSFAKSGNGEPEGFPALASGEFELIPKGHPIVQRTFMEGVGTHAILVGFPEGVNLAYDGQNARPARAWKGKFFDAYHTWFSRFAPFEKPPGTLVVKWPAPSANRTDVRFNGYRLDKLKVPTFLFSVGNVDVEERFEALPNGLRRHLRWNAAALLSLDLTHPEGMTVAEDPGSAPGQLSFTYLWK